MTHPRAVAQGRGDASPGSRFVTDIAAQTPGHIVYVAPSCASGPMILGGDTLPALRIWKNEFR
jgi:hypothetical protein